MINIEDPLKDDGLDVFIIEHFCPDCHNEFGIAIHSKSEEIGCGNCGSTECFPLEHKDLYLEITKQSSMSKRLI